jgi:hypothetical protein
VAPSAFHYTLRNSCVRALLYNGSSALNITIQQSMIIFTLQLVVLYGPL